MSYQGKFDGTAARNLYLVNQKPKKRISKAKQQRIRNQRKQLILIAVEILAKRLLVAIALLLAYACLFGCGLGLLVMMIKPSSAWGYVMIGVSAGYALLVCNCRAFEYIRDRLGPRY